MGELKIQYSDKKVTPFGGMKLLKDFIDAHNQYFHNIFSSLIFFIGHININYKFSLLKINIILSFSSFIGGSIFLATILTINSGAREKW